MVAVMKKHSPKGERSMSKRPLNQEQMKGVVGIFKDGDHLIEAAAKVRDKKVEHFDAFTPFPLHGIEEAMGLKRSFLPWITFVGGLTGCSLGLLFEIWTS